MSHSISESPANDGAVAVHVSETGANQYRIVATATFDTSLDQLWALLDDFEKLVATALPGLSGNFEWLDGGGPGRVPSRFQFDIGDARVVEELYERDRARNIMRYRLLEPGLGIRAYDAVFELARISDRQTRYTIRREVTLEPGTVDQLAGLIQLETQNLKDHFAGRA